MPHLKTKQEAKEQALTTMKNEYRGFEYIYIYTLQKITGHGEGMLLLSTIDKRV